MEKIKEWIEKVEEVLPIIWGIFLLIAITLILGGVLIWSAQWILRLLGVM